jgi:hypothetical protein
LVVSNAFGIARSQDAVLSVDAIPAEMPSRWATNTSDSGPGSLRQAILDANASPEEDVIGCQTLGVISLDSALPTITGSTRIIGPGTNLLSVSGMGRHRVLATAQWSRCAFSDFQVVDGYVTNGNGAGIVNYGTLLVTNLSLGRNVVERGGGGAIYNWGSLSLANSVLWENQVRGPGLYGGGALFNVGTLEVHSCSLIGNQMSIEVDPSNKSWAGGGAIMNQGSMTIAASRILANGVTGLAGPFGGPGSDAVGGGISTLSGFTEISTSVFEENEVMGGAGDYPTGGGKGAEARGGAIYIESGEVTVQGCAVSYNHAKGGKAGSLSAEGGAAQGGGMFLNSGKLVVRGTTLSGNESTGMAGADGRSGGDGGAARGGGIAAMSGPLSLENCTLDSNVAAGGDGGEGYHESGSRGDPGVARGGAVFGGGAELTVRHSTISGNQAVSGFWILRDPDSMYSYPWYSPGDSYGGGIHGGATPTELLNTIIAENSARTIGADCFGSFASHGSNLLGTTNGASGFLPTDLRGVDPELGPLTDNGGPTRTRAPFASSPAIDAGSSTGVPSFDQRGISRPQGAGVDIGAFELVTEPDSQTPEIVRVTASRRVLAGTDIALSVETAGTPAVNYQGERNGVPILGATQSILNLTNVALSDSGSYRVRASAGQTAATSAEVVLEVRLSLVDPSYPWVQKSSDDSSGHVSAIAVDAAGDLFVIGTFRSKLELGAGSVTAPGSGIDAFLARVNRQGEVSWIQRWGGPEYDSANAIACDAAGNVYLTGVFRQTATIGSRTVTSVGDSDVFVAKLGFGTSTRWVRQAGGSSYEEASGIAVDAPGNSVVTGSFGGSASFSGITLNRSGSRDMFLVRQSSTAVSRRQIVSDA